MTNIFKFIVLTIVMNLFCLNAFSNVDIHVDKRYKHLEAFYQDLHQYPELSNQEIRTAQKVADEFRSLGLEVTENVGGHGVIGILKNGQGPTTLVRADLDGLPVPEDTKLKYSSKNNGVMHACGHDFHLASLVGAAYVMTQTKANWRGTVIFIAQPAEEIGSGAQQMIKDGLKKRIPKPDQIISMHVGGNYKKATLGMVSGPAFANVDSVDVLFKGKGTHGSMPEKGVDPFILAAEFILKTQTLLGREKPAGKPAVISVGAIHGGVKHNIIPDDVKVLLTVRSYQPEVRKMILQRLKEIAVGISQTAKAPKAEVRFSEGTDSTYNDPKLGERLKAIFIKNFGQDKVIDIEPTMGGEDFGVFGTSFNVPSYMFWVGTKDERNPSIINHSPHFAPDFAKIAPLAVSAFSHALLDLHGTGAKK